MLRRLNALADRVVAAVVPDEVAGACCPPDPWYTCYHHAKMRCYYNCACTTFCSQVGTC
jgi:hypothetical protein